MPGYSQPCRYCDEFIPPDSNACPLCGKVNPLGPLRCPSCRSPVQQGWKRCAGCNLVLETTCSSCGEPTFFGSYCENCDAPLLVVCPNPKCKAEQPPLSDSCIKCGKPINHRE